METQDSAPNARRKPTRPDSPDYALGTHVLKISGKDCIPGTPALSAETQIDGEHQKIQ